VGYYFPSLSLSAVNLFSTFIEAEMGAKILANVSRRLEQRLRDFSIRFMDKKLGGDSYPK
jgi:hypothetical protein